MSRWIVTFWRARRNLVDGKVTSSPKAISTYAETAEQALASARARLPWRDCRAMGRVERW